ncbi:MAG: hypothetical protein GEV08_07335 [Acidimicrobiia bacterium]|nr:hypothetical protein [Acidimicrobiia bacterium]
MGEGDVLESARRVAPLARERAEGAEAAGRLPADLVAALAEAGLFRLFVPKAYGGLEVEPLVGLEAIEVVSQADGSAGWCVNIGATTATMSWYLEPEWARRIYGDPMVVTGGTFAPGGTGRVVDGGWVVDGRWGWGSGTQHCQWVNAGVRTDDGEFHLMYVPAEDVRFLDTWHVAGLEATGSTDFAIEGAFVPRGRTMQPTVSATRVDVPLAHVPNFTLLASGVATVVLGIARRAVDELASLVVERAPSLGRQPLSHLGVVQLALARAEADVASARAHLFDQVGRLWEAVRSGARPSVAQRADVRLACSAGAAAARAAVDRCFTVAGGSAVYLTSPLQRCLRDVHVASQHAMLSPRVFETWSRVRLGLDADTALL